MENREDDMQPVFSHVEPILSVTSITKTVSYWHDILGFPNKWTWGEPPDHGGVSWHGVNVQFSLDPQRAAVSAGNSIWIRVRHLERLYAIHQERKAEIIAPLENMPWGMAEYNVREINGYFIRFAAPASKTKKSDTMQPEVRIIARSPTPAEYRHLAAAVGWSEIINDEMVESLLSSVTFAVVAENVIVGEVVGCALLLGKNVSFYYVKDVMVHPDWQTRRVGSALMQEITHWAETHAEDNVLVGLFTGEQLAPFYQQFGFTPAFGMFRRIRKNVKGQ